MQPPDQFEAPPPPKSGCALKWIALLGILFGAVALVCCGVCGFIGYNVRPTMVQTAAEVDALTHEIVDVDIPDDFEGTQGAKIDFLMFFTVRDTKYRQKAGRGVLEFMEMVVKVGDKAQAENAVKQQLKTTQHDGMELKVLNVENTEQREYTIRGQKATVTFQDGADVSTGTRYHQVAAEFQGKNGPARFTLQVEDEVWNEAEIEKMLKSME